MPIARERDHARGDRRWPAAIVWAVAAGAAIALDGRVDLANLALVLVLASALSALWLDPLQSILACASAVLAFNVAFVPPRGRLSVDLSQHALLLVAMMVVGCTVALLMGRQRRLANEARELAQRAAQLQALGDALRDAEDPREYAPRLRDALSALAGAPATLMLRPAGAAEAADAASCTLVGEAGRDERNGLWLTIGQSRAMGPGTGRHEEQLAWYLPMRGRGASHGAALLRLSHETAPLTTLREQAQAMCDQLGLALERSAALAAAEAAREAARTQAMRNVLLASISHDHRTPLAAILGAASTLQEQDDRMTHERRQRLVATIVDEAAQLSRLTDNTLQLARLDAPGLALPLDWESAEEIAGTVVGRLRRRWPSRRVKVHVEPGLPLLRCDAVLIVQLLDNLVDNALKYGGADGPVEIDVRRRGERVVFAVRDRGPGVPAESRDAIFDAFRRVRAAGEERAPADAPSRRGAGVGLAVCRAITRVHGGELVLRARRHGGSSFECALPVWEQPATGAPEPEARPEAPV